MTCQIVLKLDLIIITFWNGRGNKNGGRGEKKLISQTSKGLKTKNKLYLDLHVNHNIAITIKVITPTPINEVLSAKYRISSSRFGRGLQSSLSFSQQGPLLGS